MSCACGSLRFAWAAHHFHVRPQVVQRSVLSIAAFAGLVLIGAFVAQRCRTPLTPSSTVPPCVTDCTVVRSATVTTTKGGVTFELPKAYIKHFDQTRWEPDSNLWENELNVKWPSMAPFTMGEIDGLFKEWDKTGRDPNQPNFLVDLLTIRIRQNSKTPVPISAAALEAVVTSRYGPPKPLSVLPGVQEYGENSRELAYQDLAGSQRFADGMPTYMFCRGKPLAPPAPMPESLAGGCLMQLTWPNGLEVDVRFNRVHMPKWRQLHDDAINLLRSFIIDGNLPSGSLLKRE